MLDFVAKWLITPVRHISRAMEGGKLPWGGLDAPGPLCKRWHPWGACSTLRPEVAPHTLLHGFPAPCEALGAFSGLQTPA